MKLISIIIPVFNEEQNLLTLVEEILQNFPSDYQSEILFLDDGSTDNSLSLLKELSGKYPQVRYFSFTRNFGHQAAIFAGLEHAKGDAVITMDGDFQDPPDILPKFIAKWESGLTVVLGRRKVRKFDSNFKRFSAKFYYRLLSSTSKLDVHEHVGDFRLLDRSVVDTIIKMPRKNTYLRGLIAWIGFPYEIVDYERPKRFKGETKFSFSKMLSFALDGFFSMSVVPMKFGLILGILSIFLGIFFLIYIAFDTLIYNEVYPLYKWLVVVLFMFTGFLFILIWILAEYIERIYREFQDQPLYVVKETNQLD